MENINCIIVLIVIVLYVCSCNTYVQDLVCVQPWPRCRLRCTSWRVCTAVLLCGMSPKLPALCCCIFAAETWNGVTKFRTLRVLNTFVAFQIYACHCQFCFWELLCSLTPIVPTAPKQSELSPSLSRDTFIQFLSRLNFLISRLSHDS